MTLAPRDAERLLLDRYREPAKPPSQYMIGFRAPSGKLLALHRTINETMIWLQPPLPPQIEGTELQPTPNNGNSNLNGPLAPLQKPDTQRLRIDSEHALLQFLEWYDEGSGHTSDRALAPTDFPAAFARFQDLLERKSGARFTRFDEGLVGAWERYKPDLRRLALSRLGAGDWREEEIGTGTILARTIAAIEIEEPHGGLRNNLVFWQNRYGHANREHRALLEAQRSPAETRRGERLLFDLFRNGRDEGSVFEDLRDWMGGKYPLLGYLFFLKDMERFAPIQPTGFDRAFAALGIDLRMRGNSSWENYRAFNAALDGLRGPISREAGLASVSLIDAHSFAWVFSDLLKQEASGELDTGGRASERILDAREKSIAQIRLTINGTVSQANGQIVERKVKEKELRMTDAELDRRIRELLEVQEDRCAITGLPFQFQGAHRDANMLPSLDRIDSAGHYERSNVQLVCRFINFWKQAADDAEFRRLIMVVRGEEGDAVLARPIASPGQVASERG